MGGGKTHTLAALYYAAKYGAPHVSEIKPDPRIKIVAISGEDVESKGFVRGKLHTRLSMGRFFLSIGKIL